MAVILHLSHDSEGLAHPKNIEQLKFVSEKYPNAKIQLAHCGMGHNPYMFKKGLDQILDIENLYISRCEDVVESKVMLDSLKLFRTLYVVTCFLNNMHSCIYNFLVKKYRFGELKE